MKYVVDNANDFGRVFHQICCKTIKENNIWIENTINQSMHKCHDPLSQNML